MAGGFTKVSKPQTLSQEIEQQIEKAILEKQFIPGEKMPTEFELCDMFGVSRTALREALHMLSSRGLIYVKKGRGIFVEDYSPSHVTRPMKLFLELNLDKDYLNYIVQVRRLLEPEIARLAARNRTESDLLQLEKNLIKLENCSAEDYKVEGALDRDFHLLIARSSGNPMIPLIVEPIYQIMPKIKVLIYAEIDKAKDAAMDYHRIVFEKIGIQDEGGAYEAMSRHMDIAEEHMKIISDKL